MCKTALHGFLQALPKCEQHMHLEGALTPELLFQLANKNNVQLPSDDPAFASVATLTARYTRFTSLDDFLHYYFIGFSVLQHSADFEALAWDYFRRAAADNVIHAEVFFDPQAHTSRGVSVDAVLAGFHAARARAQTELGISSELICCFLRHLPVPECLATFDLPALQRGFEKGEIAGIGLDSSERDFPPELFAELYAKANTMGIRRTAHAGEEGPATYIRGAIDTLSVTRIDHGIRLADDVELMRLVAERNVLLTLCPVSNILLRCAARVADLPIRTFLQHGVNFSINSDDPAYFGGHYILDNYCAVQEAFDLSVEEWTGIVEASIRGSWCGEERREEMLRMLDGVVTKWRS